MLGRKAIQVISAMELAQWKRFQLFAQSPYHNQHKRVVESLNWLDQFYPDFTHKRATESNFYKAIFDEKKIDRNRFNKFFSQLFTLLEEFIAVEEIKHSADAAYLYAQAQYSHFRKAGLPSLDAAKEKQVRKELQEQNTASHARLLNKYRFEMELARRASAEDDRKGDINLAEVNLSLDLHYFLAKLTHLCLMNNRESVVQIDYQKPLQEALFQMVDDHPHLQILPIKVYQAALQLLLEPDQQKYEKLSGLLELEQLPFDKAELHALYTYLSISCKKVYQSNQPQYYAKRYAIFRACLDKGLLLHQDQMTNQTFKNGVVLGIRNEQYEETQTFITKYHEKLAEHSRASTRDFCQALLYFHQGDYVRSQKLLSQVDHDDIYYLLNTRRLLAMIYYEQADWQVLENHLASLKVYVYRRKKQLPPAYFKSNDHFVNTLIKLVKIAQTLGDKTKVIAKLQEKMGALNSLSERVWLEEKLRKLAGA